MQIDKFRSPGIYVNANMNTTPQLVILEHPVDKFRFRYKSEMHGTHGSLTGSRSVKPNKTYPEIELRNFNKSGIIRCSLYQTNTTKPSLHSHLLVVHKEDKDVNDPHDVCVSPELGYIVRFENMGIIHTAKKDVAKELLQKKVQKLKFDVQCEELSMKLFKSLRDEADREAKLMNLNQVCLCFEAFELIDERHYKRICEPVYSNPINNLKSALTGELRICRLSISTGSVEGNDDLILLVEKVNKNNIKVRFFELSNDEEVWEAHGSFTEADVHHQYAIVVRTPPYRDKEIDNHVNVFIELVRESDNKRSDPIPFRYKPKSIVMSRKRRRVSNSSSSLNSTSPSNSFEIPETMPQQIQKLKLEPRASSISEESSGCGTYESSESNEYVCEFNTFMQQCDVDSDELNKLLQEPIFSSTYFGMWDNDLQIDGEGSIRRTNKQLAFHPALKLLIQTFNDCSEIGFEKTIKRIKLIFYSYTAQNDNANTIIHDLCKKSNQREAAIVFKILSKLNLTHLFRHKNNNLQTPLHVACSVDQPIYIRPLIGFMCDPNVQDIDGNTPLHIAVRDNLLQCFEELVSNITSSKLNVNLINNDGMTPLHMAIRKNNIEFVRILLFKCNASVKLANCRDGNNALHLAVQQENSDIVKIILESSDPSNLNITNRASHTAIDLAKALKNPKRDEILNICSCFSTAFVDDQKDHNESSNSSGEDDIMTVMNVNLSEKEEKLIRAQIQKDPYLCKNLVKILTIDGKWKKFVRELKLDHLLCIWSNAEAMLKDVLEGEEHVKLLKVFYALQAVDEEAASFMSSYIMKHLNHV